jgi:hypothetical protein|tara:strand:- start:212 stop:580 length:369 start_codon:yes stop_codon:yes gene_type:complete
MLISDKAMHVSSTTGQSAWFEAGVAQEVPPPLVDECIAAGAYPVGSKKTAKTAAVKEVVIDEVSDEDRTMEIVSAIEQLVEEGDTKSFSKNGEPKVRSLEKILGYDITQLQRDIAWAEISEA